MPLPIDASPLVSALSERGYTDLTPVQEAVLRDDARGRDLLVSAQTGSGKTVAYGMVIGETLLGSDDALPPAGQPLALVVAPTRELAMQVERELTWLFANAGGRVVVCVGGMDPRAERRRLDLGAHIVVGTPGRLRDHIDRRALDISALKVVVLDEADEMLDLGFREDLEYILEATPPERRTLLFSATLPHAIVSIAQRFQRDAARIATVGATRSHADIEHRAIRVSPRQADNVVVNVLRQQDAAAAIVFCQTREAVRRLHERLAKRGFSVVMLSGELGQAERNRAMEDIRDGRARVCVATDVAARGIDLPMVELVIHADLPHDAEVFQHRSGRTGRAGRKGVSVLLAPASRRRKAELMLSDAGVTPVWTAPPTADEIRALDQQRLDSDPAMSLKASEDERARARALLERHGAEEIAVALLRLHIARLPEPEFVEDPGDWGPSRERARPMAPGYGGEARPPRPSRHEAFGDSVWFRLGVGRKQNADPKWLLPLICRRGGVTRNEIGAIRIFDGETKVAIAASHADAFAAAALGAVKNDVLITRADAPEARAYEPNPAPARPKPAYDKPSYGEPGFAKPAYGKITSSKTAYDPTARDKGPGAKPAKAPRWPDNAGADNGGGGKVGVAKGAPARPWGEGKSGLGKSGLGKTGVGKSGLGKPGANAPFAAKSARPAPRRDFDPRSKPAAAARPAGHRANKGK